VQIDRKTIYLGLYKDIEEATTVVKEFRSKNNFTESHGIL
jgi:hypothetical protein